MLTKNIMMGIAHELGFWKGFVQEKRFIEGWVPSNIKTPDLQPEIYSYFVSLNDYLNLKVLDLGSGAVSVLNGTFPKENITTVDPLGALYPFIFDYSAHGIAPPFPCGGEEIDFERQFDIVHISNAIDHSQNPSEVFRRMKLACKSGGLLVVQGLVDEAVHENWEGFHQWNFHMQPSGYVAYCGRNLKEIYLEGGEQVFKLIKHFPHVDRHWFISVWKNN